MPVIFVLASSSLSGNLCFPAARTQTSSTTASRKEEHQKISPALIVTEEIMMDTDLEPQDVSV